MLVKPTSRALRTLLERPSIVSSRLVPSRAFTSTPIRSRTQPTSRSEHQSGKFVQQHKQSPSSSSSSSPKVFKQKSPSVQSQTQVEEPWANEISWDDFLSDEVTKGNKQYSYQKFDDKGQPIGEPVLHEDDRVILFENGTIVETTDKASSNLGVVLDTVLFQSQMKLRIISPEGSINYLSPTRVTFAFQHKQVSPSWVALCGPGDAETRADRVNYRVGIAKRARMVLKETEGHRVRLDGVMEGAWERLRPKDQGMEGSRRLMTTKEIVREVMRDHPGGHKEDLEVMTYAVHRFLMTCPERFICEESGQWKSLRWWLRSAEEVQEMEKTKQWAHTNDPRISEFVSKCVTLIDHSRPALFAMPPAPEEHVLPSFLPQNTSLPTFSPSDLHLISHIQKSLSISTKQIDPFASTVPLLLKQTERYGEIITKHTIRQFLVEIGVRTEWDDLAALSSSLEVAKELGLGKGEKRPFKLEIDDGSDDLIEQGMMPGPGEDSLANVGRSSPIQLLTEEKHASSTSTPKPAAMATNAPTPASHPATVSPTSRSSSVPLAAHKSNTLLGPDELYPTDPMSNLRHDFGDLPVFVIDDPNAFELDDGVSIEPSRPGFCWIHVHIADPTSILHPNHRLSKAAERMGQTLYLPQGNRSLLPDDVSVDRFSLGGQGLDPINGQPALTFSAEVDEKMGDIVNYKVRASTIRNIKVTSYQAVNEVFRCETSPIAFPLGLTYIRPKLKKPKQADPAWFPDLNYLYRVSESIAIRRLKKGGISWSLSDFSVALNPSPPPSLPLDAEPVPKFTSGSPVVEYIVHPQRKLANDRAQLIVHSCMTLAGNVAGRFFADRNLPAPYRTSPSPRAAQQSALEELLEKRKSITGEVDPYDVARLGVVFVAGRLSMRPESHWMMGIEGDDGGYVRVTSPLRRYTDILAHWQIKNALLHEASRFSVGPSSVKKGVLWNIAEMEEMASSVDLTVALGTSVQRESKAFWGTYALERYARREDPLPNLSENFPPPQKTAFSPSPSPTMARLGPFEASFVLQPSQVTYEDAGTAKVTVMIPALGLQLVAYHPVTKMYEAGERVSVLLDRFLLGPRSSVTGTIVE
ncbi:Exosomal 3'-5' exoribonuclease complex, subunit Rrp44/Dis3 [Phaffia rhodozyma]|uniref:Exosomal 3'-5' exoribonuclease complex, subunit Rrp44/Dis3 n=1 Tax=Phaffia rhodozyma TaxID=264483 RepID=A0A0F7SED1_PHARH|nr:Exosomal 3'-5' exoribonuclease complex, subunit Rrp44/Dis3 [Phaffia rhodozyma]